MHRNEILHLQRLLNSFTERFKGLGYHKLQVDGDLGRLTKDRIRDVKYLIGYKRENLNYDVDENFIHRAERPLHVEPRWGQTKEAVARGKARRAHRHRWWLRNRIRAFLHPGVTNFDGRPVAKAVVPVLRWCREVGYDGERWHGGVVSGYRTPAYSEQLCFQMCGRPSCPGRCAGRATNHAYATPDRFAVDVSDYINFARIVAHCPIKPHIHNALPNDLVHFSPSGN